MKKDPGEDDRRATPPPPELYIVLLEDLTPGQRLAQTAHVVGSFFRVNEGNARYWSNSGRVIIVTAKQGELDLLLIGATSHFVEQDLQGALTALTFFQPNEHAKRVLAKLRLAA